MEKQINKQATFLQNTDCSLKSHTYAREQTTVVSDHFALAGHSMKKLEIPLELINSHRDRIGKAREAYFMSKGKTLEPNGINRLDETYCVNYCMLFLFFYRFRLLLSANQVSYPFIF